MEQPTETMYTYEQVKQAVEDVGFEFQARVQAVSFAVKYLDSSKSDPLLKPSTDALLATSQKIAKFLITGSTKPLTEG